MCCNEASAVGVFRILFINNSSSIYQSTFTHHFSQPSYDIKYRPSFDVHRPPHRPSTHRPSYLPNPHLTKNSLSKSRIEQFPTSQSPNNFTKILTSRRPDFNTMTSSHPDSNAMTPDSHQARMVEWLMMLDINDTDAVQMTALLNQGGFDTIKSLLYLPTALLTPQNFVTPLSRSSCKGMGKSMGECKQSRSTA